MTKASNVPEPIHESPLAEQLGLTQDDLNREARLARLPEDFRGKFRTPVPGNVAWLCAEADGTGELPLPKDWRDWPVLTPRSIRGTTQRHAWLVTEMAIPTPQHTDLASLGPPRAGPTEGTATCLPGTGSRRGEIGEPSHAHRRRAALRTRRRPCESTRPVAGRALLVARCTPRSVRRTGTHPLWARSRPYFPHR